MEGFVPGGLQPPELDTPQSDSSEIAAFKSRRMKRRPTLAKQYRLLGLRRQHLTSGGQSQDITADSAHEEESNEHLMALPTPKTPTEDIPDNKLESMKSAYAYEAHTINWKEDQEEKELKKRQQKVLRNAGTLKKHIMEGFVPGGLQPPELDTPQSDSSEIAAFKSRRMKRRPTLAKQYRLLGLRRQHLTSGGQSQDITADSAHEEESNEHLMALPTPKTPTEDIPDNKLESMKSAYAYEAHTINWKEDQEEKELKKRQQKVLRNAGTLKKHMYDLTESIFFNGFILVVILLNTSILCALTFDIVVVRAGWYFTFLDYIFLVIYFIECVLKIYVWRLDYFKEQWNIIDFVIVLTNIADFLVSTLMGNSVSILSFITIFRAMRALRALRVLRTVRFLKSLQVIMTTCLQSVQSMGAITMLISLFLYMFAVIGRGLYAEVDPKRFGNLGSAMITLFQLLTLDDWFYVYTDAVKKDPTYWHIILYLIMFIATEYFIFLNSEEHLLGHQTSIAESSLSLFVAVLVDNFQLTIEAAAEREADRKVAMKAEEDKDEAELLTKQEITRVSTETIVKVRKTIDDYYADEDKYSTSDKQHLAHFLGLLASLEYNGHVMRNQHGTLNNMVDIVQVPLDDT